VPGAATKDTATNTVERYRLEHHPRDDTLTDHLLYVPTRVRLPGIGPHSVAVAYRDYRGISSLSR